MVQHGTIARISSGTASPDSRVECRATEDMNETVRPLAIRFAEIFAVRDERSRLTGGVDVLASCDLLVAKDSGTDDCVAGSLWEDGRGFPPSIGAGHGTDVARRGSTVKESPGNRSIV